jgi:hypothetical protein
MQTPILGTSFQLIRYVIYQIRCTTFTAVIKCRKCHHFVKNFNGVVFKLLF